MADTTPTAPDATAPVMSAALLARRERAERRARDAHALIAAGRTRAEVAATIGVSERRVRGLLAEYPASTPPPVHDPTPDERQALALPNERPTSTGSTLQRDLEPRGRILPMIRTLNAGPGPVQGAYVAGSRAEREWQESGAGRKVSASHTGMPKMISPDGFRRLAIEPQDAQAHIDAGWAFA